MTSTTDTALSEDAIADYLLHQPEFFERHAELLRGVQLTSGHGPRAVSLQERQAEMLREKIKGLELRSAEMIRHGQENSAIADRLHRWTRELLMTRDTQDLPERFCEIFVADPGHRFVGTVRLDRARYRSAAALEAASPLLRSDVGCAAALCSAAAEAAELNVLVNTGLLAPDDRAATEARAARLRATVVQCCAQTADAVRAALRGEG